jgi:hypothetical protein
MKLGYILVFLGLCHAGWARAEIYKHVDADGHVTYSGTPFKGAKKLQLEPLPTMRPVRTNSREEAANFPRVDAATQKDRDGTRKQILESELAAEEKALAEARAELRKLAESPKGSIIGSASQERVQMHEKNIEALKTELANSNK